MREPVIFVIQGDQRHRLAEPSQRVLHHPALVKGHNRIVAAVNQENGDIDLVHVPHR